jgi:L-aminopeptidase/D-esterase-like protein
MEPFAYKNARLCPLPWLADTRSFINAGLSQKARAEQNTTIGVVATNARLSKVQATKIAQMAHDGFARAIAPAHTPVDGDTIFAWRQEHMQAM